MSQAHLFEPDGYWSRVRRTDRRARALADRHYSRQTPGAAEFMASGRVLVMLAELSGAFAVWGAIENLDPAGNRRWRCSIFRNETLVLSSALIEEATERTYAFWLRHYSGLPAVPLTTEVDPSRVLHKRDPGRCFIKAGWRVVRHARGLVVLEAPDCRVSGEVAA